MMTRNRTVMAIHTPGDAVKRRQPSLHQAVPLPEATAPARRGGGGGRLGIEARGVVGIEAGRCRIVHGAGNRGERSRSPKVARWAVRSRHAGTRTQAWSDRGLRSGGRSA